LTNGVSLRQNHIRAKKMEELQLGEFDPIFTQFRGKPKEAIKYLRQQEQGECIASLHRDDIGDIDIVWGEVTDPIKHKGFGLSHIIDKHEAEIKQLGFEVEDFVPIVVQFGELKEKKSDDKKITLESQMFRVIIQKKWNGKDKTFLLSAFDLRKKPR
jgi:hypothetical protein